MNMFKYLWIVMLFSLVACTAQLSSENPNLTPTSTIIAITEVTVVEPTGISTPTPITTPAVAIEPSPTLPPITPTPVPMITLKAGCPTIVDSTKPAIWSTGSILFNWGRIHDRYSADYVVIEQPGIWAISAKNLAPLLFYEPARSIRISPDGMTLLSLKAASAQSRHLVFSHLVTGETLRIPVSDEVYLPSWLLNGQVRTGHRLETNLGVGQIWELYTIDPETQEVEHTILELNLPEYEFFEYDVERGRPSGFVSVDPTYQRVLYTAGDGGIGPRHEIRLLDLETGEILWRISTPSLPETTPEWSEDGSSVLFRMGEPIPGTDAAWSRIVSLTRDGVEEELPPQPFPQAESYVANVSRSPNGRFIFYSLYSYETSRLHGYVVDTLTWEAGDVCDPDHDLFGSVPYDKVEVDWLPDGQLVYRVLIENEDGSIAHSLRVLDIPSWTAQVIFEAEPGYGVNVFGWTPVEFP